MGFGTVVEAKRLIGRADRPADGRLDGGPVLELAFQLGRCDVEQLAHGKAGAARIEAGRGLVEQLVHEEFVDGLGLFVGDGGFAPLPGHAGQTAQDRHDTERPGAAGKGLRRHHIQARVAGPTGRASIGSPPSQRFRSSARARALG